MSDKNNGWKRPEEKYVEAELEDNFEAFFSEGESPEVPKGKRRRRSRAAAPEETLEEKGPDILAVSDGPEDSGFVITKVVSVEGGEPGPKPKAPEEPSTESGSAGQPEISDNAPECPAPESDEAGAAPAAAKAAAPAADAAARKASPSGAAQADAPKEAIPAPAPEEGEEAPAAEPEEAPAKGPAPAEGEEKGAEGEKRRRLFPRAKKIISQRRKHRYAATIGAALIVLALIGSASVISALVNFTGRLIENTRQKEKFEWKIYPVLMLDPASFDDPSQLDGVFLLKSALWSTLLENRSTYSYDENGLLVVPASDLDVAAKKLYGDGVSLEHQTFSEGYEFFYVYDEETNSYSVPISGQAAGYTPKVIKITKNGDIYTLIVGYVAPVTLWNVTESGVSGERVPDKYLYYDLQKVSGGDYIIKAVRSIPASELPDDLEVADYQQINATQYFDYEQQYQDYLAGLQEEQAAGDGAQDENASGESSEGTSSEGASSEETSSEDSAGGE